MGLKSLIKSENNFQFHFVFSILVLIFSVFLKIDKNEWFWVILCIFLMFASEAFNTAIEKLCDRITLEHDTKIGLIKDISAAGVLLIAIFSILIGLFIFIPKIIFLFS